MSIYKQANELSQALSSLLRRLEQSMNEVDGVPVNNKEEYEHFQSLICTAVFLQKNLDDFLEKAMVLGDQGREGPVEIMDFTGEWDRFD